MKKIRALIVSLLVAASSLFVVANDVTPVSAQLSNCAQGGEYYYGGTYAGVICFSYAPSNGTVRATITCRYRLLGVNHTYVVNGNNAYPGNWSWASCGNHNHDQAYGDPYRDRIIHAAPVFANGWTPYTGSCGACGSAAWPSGWVF